MQSSLHLQRTILDWTHFHINITYPLSYWNEPKYSKNEIGGKSSFILDTHGIHMADEVNVYSSMDGEGGTWGKWAQDSVHFKTPT